MQRIIRPTIIMITQFQPNVTGSVVSNPADLSASGKSGVARLVTKEQVFADDDPAEVFEDCQNPKRPWLWANDFDAKRVLVVRPACKLWKCPQCAQRNRRKWAVRIYQGLEHYATDGRSWWFATVTMRGGKRDFARDIAVWRDGWAKLYLRMKRHTGKGGNPHLRYVLLPELAPKTGRLHVHMLLNDHLGAVPTKSSKRPFRSDFLKDAGAQVGLGYMNDIRPVDDAKLASWYVSKYVGKSLGVGEWPEHFRRVRTSVGWPELKREESIGDDLNWNIADERKICEIVEKFWSVGFDAVNLNTGELLETIDLTY